MLIARGSLQSAQSAARWRNDPRRMILSPRNRIVAPGPEPDWSSAPAAAKAAEEKKRSTRPSSSKDKGKKKALSTEELEKLKEKKLMKLVGAVVVKCMSKYRDRMEHDAFKKHAKEVSCALQNCIY